MEIGAKKFAGNEAYKERLRVGIVEKIVTKFSLMFSYFLSSQWLKVIGEISTSSIFQKNEISKQIRMHDSPSLLVWIPLACNFEF